MKKYLKHIIAATATIALAASSYGQGYVLLDNLNNTGSYLGNSGGGSSTPFNGSTGNPAYSALVTSNGLFFTTDPADQAGPNGYTPSTSTMIGADFSFAIYGGSTAGTATTLLASFTGGEIVGDCANWGQLEGPTALATPVGSGALTTVWMQVFAWEGNTFSTYAAAVLGGDYAGFTPVFQNPSASSSEAPVIPNMTGMPDLIMSVPEPTTLALAGLGGAALLALRRRKA
jgi:hypothetical protein